MAAKTKKGYITPRDLLRRESTLCDYLASWIGQAELCLTVTRESCNTSLLPLCSWATSLASLQHQIEERSQLLSSTALHDTSRMLDLRMSYYSATVICSQLLEARND